MYKDSQTILYTKGVLYLATVLFFVNDAQILLLNPKWDGMLSWITFDIKYLIILDLVLSIIFLLMFILAIFPTIKTYRWKTLWIFLLSIPAMFIMFLVYIYFLFPLLHLLF